MVVISSVGALHLVHALQYLALGGGVEVDHHVAAEDDVKGLAQGPVGAHQVEGAELDAAGQLGPHAHLAGVAAGAAHEMAALPLSRQATRIGVVNPRLGGGQHLGVDVAGDDAHLGLRAQGLGHRHGDGIGLFAGGRGAAPDAQAAAGARAQVVGQRAEVMVFAEEGGQVGGQAVHELLPLGLGLGRAAAALLQPLQVVSEVGVACLAQAARQPAVDHGLLAGIQADARALVDQAAHLLVVGG